MKKAVEGGMEQAAQGYYKGRLQQKILAPDELEKCQESCLALGGAWRQVGGVDMRDVGV